MDNIVYLDYDQAIELVDRIAKRAENFGHIMVENEKESMAELLASVGVNVDNIVCVNNYADNYAINAEIVGPDEVDYYSQSSLNEALFTWQEDGETYYCLTW